MASFLSPKLILILGLLLCFACTSSGALRKRASPQKKPTPVVPVCPQHQKKTVDVGGPNGWIAANMSLLWTHPPLYVGDNLRFSWPDSQEHNVIRLPDLRSYSSCNSDPGTEIERDQPILVTLTARGTYYFICDEGSHCTVGGQKIAVQVYAAPLQDCSPPPHPPHPPRPPPSPPASLAPKTVVIGGSIGKNWAVSIFSLWTPPVVHKGDTLEFKWNDGSPHNVWLVNQADFTSCIVPGTNSKLLAGGDQGALTGDYKYYVKENAGTTLYFVCNAQGFHCFAQMKVAITVS